MNRSIDGVINIDFKPIINNQMKKAIILSGPQASGKTHTAYGISNFFDKKNVAVVHSSNFRKIWKFSSEYPEPGFRLENPELIVVEECKDMKQIRSFESTMEVKPNCSFIFTTLSKVLYSDIDQEKYHLIQCKWNADR